MNEQWKTIDGGWIRCLSGTVRLFLAVSASCVAFVFLRYQAALLRTISFPEALINITDNSAYSQIASWYANGRTYLPLDRGVGHIYHPMNSLWVIFILHLGGIEPTPFACRLILQCTFWCGAALGGLALGIVLRRAPMRMLARFAMVGAGVMLAYFWMLLCDFTGVYTVHLLVLLLSITLFLSIRLLERPWGISHAILLTLFPFVGAAVFMTSPSYVLTMVALSPALWLMIRERRWSGSACLAMGSIVAGALLLSVYSNADVRTWTLEIPLMQHRYPAAHLLQSRLMHTSVLILLVVLVAFVSVARTWSRFPAVRPVSFFLGSALVASFVPALKVGGSVHNFVPVAFYSVIFAFGLLWTALSDPDRRWLDRSFSALNWCILLAACFFPVRWAATVGPRQFAPEDYRQVACVSAVLDASFTAGLTSYIDTDPAYYASRHRPYSYEAAHIWETEQSEYGQRSAYRALKKLIDRRAFDIIILHVPPPRYDVAYRLLGSAVVDSVRSNYVLVGHMDSSAMSDRGQGDVKLNSRAAFFVRADAAKFEVTLETMLSQFGGVVGSAL